MNRVDQARLEEVKREVESQISPREARTLISFIETVERQYGEGLTLDQVRHSLNSLARAADDARVIASRVAAR